LFFELSFIGLAPLRIAEHFVGFMSLAKTLGVRMLADVRMGCESYPAICSLDLAGRRPARNPQHFVQISLGHNR
jgi:hypothetical protein